MAHNQGIDDIPLQNRSLKDNEAEPNDHVYEGRQRGTRRRTGVGFGDLGMFGANAKRIPWCVYFFTIAQVAVFIGEIVRNGRRL
jgi:hypothetical protein